MGGERHSITSSARARIDGGTVRPSIFAVFGFDDQLELRRLLDREIGRFGAPQDLVDVVSREPKHIGEIRAIRHQITRLGRTVAGLARRVDKYRPDRGQTVPQRGLGASCGPAERRTRHHQRVAAGAVTLSQGMLV